MRFWESVRANSMYEDEFDKKNNIHNDCGCDFCI